MSSCMPPHPPYIQTIPSCSLYALFFIFFIFFLGGEGVPSAVPCHHLSSVICKEHGRTRQYSSPLSSWERGFSLRLGITNTVRLSPTSILLRTYARMHRRVTLLIRSLLETINEKRKGVTIARIGTQNEREKPPSSALVSLFNCSI
jgi:hypothetical protein